MPCIITKGKTFCEKTVGREILHQYRKDFHALTTVSWLVVGSTPSQGTYLIWACGGGNPSMFLSHTDVSLSPFLSLSKSNEKLSLGKDIKIKEI